LVKGKPTKRPSCPALDKILGIPIPVLDQGFVRVVDYMGTEARIVQAARVSMGEGTKTPAEDAELVRYLMRHKHTSPFEQLQLTLHCKLPIFVARQWIRHRTARVNELSGRYSTLKDEFYVPDLKRIKYQDKVNRQGSGESVPTETARKILEVFQAERVLVHQGYEGLVNQGVSRELARINLPVATYTEWFWNSDLHNLLHFLRLRCDEHAQWEMRQYANVIRDKIVALWVPNVYRAFEDFVTGALVLSRPELRLLAAAVDVGRLKTLLQKLHVDKDFATEVIKELGISAVELREGRAKFIEGPFVDAMLKPSILD
jgi:thymidylate synthase (FAD)